MGRWLREKKHFPGEEACQVLLMCPRGKRVIPGRRWGERHDGAWFNRLGVFRLSGNVRRVAAHASR